MEWWTRNYRYFPVPTCACSCNCLPISCDGLPGRSAILCWMPFFLVCSLPSRNGWSSASGFCIVIVFRGSESLVTSQSHSLDFLPSRGNSFGRVMEKEQALGNSSSRILEQWKNIFSTGCMISNSLFWIASNSYCLLNMKLNETVNYAPVSEAYIRPHFYICSCIVSTFFKGTDMFPTADRNMCREVRRSELCWFFLLFP